MALSLQQFIPLLSTQDIKKRIQLGSDILSCLQDPSCILECDDIGFFIDSISSWLNNSNFKVSYAFFTYFIYVFIYSNYLSVLILGLTLMLCLTRKDV